jgi:hypothetical protein
MGDKIGNVARKERRDTAANWTSNNPIPLEGEICLETDTDGFKIGNGTNTWTELISYFTPGYRQSYSITTASDETVALPNATTTKASYVIKRTGVGTGKVLFTTVSSQTINGTAASTWNIEGEGEIELYSDGLNWQVKTYSDALAIADSTGGTASYDNRQVRKYIDGGAEICGEYANSSVDLTILSAGWYTTSGDLNALYGYTLSSASKAFATSKGGSGPNLRVATPTTTLIPLRFYRGDSSSGVPISGTWRVLGTWK